MKLTLSLPPSKNAIHVRTRFGIALSHKARAWKKEAITEILMQSEARGLSRLQKWAESDKLLVIEVKCYFPDRRKRDAHNCFEILADALQEAIGIDDSYYLMRAMAKVVDKEDPRIEVTIREDE